MRTPLFALFLALPFVALAQRNGNYRSQAWSISPTNTLVWSGQPYLPVGLTVPITATQSVQAASTSGVKDLILDAPANGTGWEASLKFAESQGMRYLLRINSIAPLAKGIAVQPQSYRVSGINTERSIVVRLPGASSALTILAATRDSYVESVQRIKVNNGVLTLDVKPLSDLDHVLLIYPVTEGLQLPDFWEGLDDHRDGFLSSLAKNNLGPGLRGIVNPLGRTVTLQGNDQDFVPTSKAFQLELAQLLESRYRNMETAMRSWSMSGSSFSIVDEKNQRTGSFGDLARLVPLWNGVRGIPQLWDPETDKLYPCDIKRSTIWKDISDTISSSAARRYERLVSAIQSIVDVPIIQDWSGWSAPYEQQVSPIDGIGVVAQGPDNDSLVRSSSRAVSSLLRWKNPGWLVGTSIVTGDPAVAVEQLSQMGIKGFFFEGSSSGQMAAIAAEASKRSSDTETAEIRPTPVFFPENAWNPANPQRLPGGKWWLPAPIDGNRIDFGPDYKAYRMSLNGVATVALWSRVPGRVKLRMIRPVGVVFSTIDGGDPNPKVVKGGVEVNLTDYPLLITGTEEIPVPDPALTQLVGKFGKLLEEAMAKHRDATEERLAFEQAATGFDRNPGGNFATMIDQYYRAAQRLGSFTWIEAERVQETNFSEAIQLSSASNGGALALRTTIPPDKAYYAEYTIPVRSTEVQHVWVAARIPAEQRPMVQILIGGQSMVLEESPINGYGDGYAWYRVGTTRLAGGSSKLRVTVVAPDGADLAIDAILLTPTNFVPNGTVPPDPLG